MALNTTILRLSFLLLFFASFVNANNSSCHTLSTNRKLLSTKFDFTPFLHHHHYHHRHRPDNDNAKPSGNEIDPRYGVEQRLVTTGPNPLHH
ncbi:CLAVATA3/ESR (CLE)-related protein 12-like [Hibiscus syriacus]|uniref:CLAVATA3/ESR (CLE)-related protein 12-like n=1 Tax=Hibiscus syriacus TaxID=106335 RepID=UPI001924E9B5|nr:CLAVATA3/ESR (CLE)-related protein 12-like [Hibiscus syriacus]